jgi:hypothetical protein
METPNSMISAKVYLKRGGGVVRDQGLKLEEVKATNTIGGEGEGETNQEVTVTSMGYTLLQKTTDTGPMWAHR